MSTTEMNELELKQRERELKKIEGKPQHIEFSDRTIKAYREEYAKKGMVIIKEEEYPKEDFHMVAKQKNFDRLVDPSQGIKKIIQSMIRQPVTIFDKNGRPEIKDALYYNGYYYGTSKRGDDLGAPFHEGSYKKPKMSFTYSNTGQTSKDYDEQGERRGTYTVTRQLEEYYIFLSEDKKERRKQLEAIIAKSPGTYTAHLEGGHLHYRNPSPDNSRHGGHGGSFTWDQFCDLSLEQLGEAMNKNYYSDDQGIIRDRTGERVSYDPSTKKVQSVEGR